MTQASHYVIEEILEVFKGRDTGIINERFKTFVERYPDDPELGEIYRMFCEVSQEKGKGLKNVVEKLEGLKKIRALGSEGGTNLPYKDRRHFGGEAI